MNKHRLRGLDVNEGLRIFTHTTGSASLMKSSSEDIRADSDDRMMTSGSDADEDDDADDDDTLNTSSLSSSLASYDNSASEETCSTNMTLSSVESMFPK